ncbi:hypothetical protein H4582DRAFT_741758 [Lactarius indigo]|nr:hypothetical protein H4582DRAFT_741758 [Lactarius indigo]
MGFGSILSPLWILLLIANDRKSQTIPQLRQELILEATWDKCVPEDVLERLTRLLDKSLVSYSILGFPLWSKRRKTHAGYVSTASMPTSSRNRERKLCVFEQKGMQCRHDGVGLVVQAQASSLRTLAFATRVRYQEKRTGKTKRLGLQ